MKQYLTKAINIPLGVTQQETAKRICRSLNIRESDLQSFRLYKRSVDARDKSNVHFVCSYVAAASARPANAAPYAPPVNVLDNAPALRSDIRILVVGSGPAGLFSALYLAKCGLNVTVIERGSDISERKSKVTSFFNGGELDENCNAQFGLGGAGTFSDGKLTTGTSSKLIYTVFDQFVRSGAPRDILTDALPHVGTDNLEQVVANMRDEIISYGGKFMFDTTLSDLVVSNGSVTFAEVIRNGKTERLKADCIILACGHSARDTFEMLSLRGAEMSFKPFAVGLRIEHEREFINRAQYGELFAAHRDLSSASYKLVNNCADGRGCYSFCMCPGGAVVAAASERNSVVVNGMSDCARKADNSNSAIVVTVNAADISSFGYGEDTFAGVRFQRDLERKAFVLGGGNYVAPCQNAADFIANATSASFVVSPSYSRGVRSVNLRTLLPKEISDDLASSLAYFNNRIKGFADFGVLTGVETRTSSPVRIVRREDFQSNIRNLYPVGEGAGYAGGIVSSAVDGLRAALSIANGIAKKTA